MGKWIPLLFLLPCFEVCIIVIVNILPHATVQTHQSVSYATQLNRLHTGRRLQNDTVTIYVRYK